MFMKVGSVFANSADPDEMQQYAAILLHFIWVFTICQRTRLWGFRIQGAKE